jgi:hypothetical protein
VLSQSYLPMSGQFIVPGFKPRSLSRLVSPGYHECQCCESFPGTLPGVMMHGDT